MTESKKCQEILQRAREHTKIQLASIAKLDKELSKIIVTYNNLTTSFLNLSKLKDSQESSTSLLNELIDKI